jgi:peptidoglycan hydrolase-like protein with peptidoglycan-binding domain
MRIFAAIVAMMLGASAALAQSDGRTRPDPPAAAAKAGAKARLTKPKARPRTEAQAEAKPEAKTDGKAREPRKKAAKEKSKPASVTTAKSGTSGSANATAPEPKSPPALRDFYNAMSFADRMTIQSDLTWGGDYNGPIDGEFSERLAEAVRAYQKRHKEPVTGFLTAEQRTSLAAAVKPRKEAVGWQLVDDAATGARLGVPEKFATKTMPGPNGTRWTSEQGQFQIATFRIDTGANIEGVFEQQKKLPRRRIESSGLQGDSFVIRGMQGLKKMVVRGFARNGEVRGLTILYDQAMEGSVDPLVAPMTSAYVPFPSFALASAGGQPRRKVEYGTGIFVSPAGHVLTDRRLVEGCNIIALPGLGNAERVAVERDGDLALLRIYGANITPVGLIGAPAPSADATLIGIADPQSQGGAADVSAVPARIGVTSTDNLLEGAPALGFSGAAVLDTQARFTGIVATKPSQVAGPAGAPRAAVIPAERIKDFLLANDVAPTTGQPGIDETKAAVTRVICVRN